MVQMLYLGPTSLLHRAGRLPTPRHIPWSRKKHGSYAKPGEKERGLSGGQGRPPEGQLTPVSTDQAPF